MTDATTNFEGRGCEPPNDFEAPTLPESPDGGSTGKQCPVCSGELQLRQGRNGAFLGCSGFPSCRFTVDPNAPVEPSPDHKCPDCGSAMLKRRCKTGHFLSCSRYPQCQATRHLPGEHRPPSHDDEASGSPPPRRRPPRPPIPSDTPCPLCASEMLEHDGPTGEYLRCTSQQCRKTIDCAGLRAAKGETCRGCRAPMVVRQGRKGAFLGCSRYPECSVTRDAADNTETREPPSDRRREEGGIDVSAAPAA